MAVWRVHAPSRLPTTSQASPHDDQSNAHQPLGAKLLQRLTVRMRLCFLADYSGADLKNVQPVADPGACCAECQKVNQQLTANGGSITAGCGGW